MYRKYRIVESIANSVSQYETYRDQVYRYTPNENIWILIKTSIKFVPKDPTNNISALV